MRIDALLEKSKFDPYIVILEKNILLSNSTICSNVLVLFLMVKIFKSLKIKKKY